LKWTKCSDQMPDPEEHKRVLIYVSDIVLEIGGNFFDFSTDELIEKCSSARAQTNTYWTPLPYPKKEEL
jgi:hypothetical protein